VVDLTLAMRVERVDFVAAVPEFVLNEAIVELDAATLIEVCEALSLVLRYPLLKGTIAKVETLFMAADDVVALVLDRTTTLEVTAVIDALELTTAMLEVLTFPAMLDAPATAALDVPAGTALPTLTGELLFG